MNQWIVVVGIGALLCGGGCLKQSQSQPANGRSAKPEAAQQAASSERPSEHPTEHPR